MVTFVMLDAKMASNHGRWKTMCTASLFASILKSNLQQMFNWNAKTMINVCLIGSGAAQIRDLKMNFHVFILHFSQDGVTSAQTLQLF